MSNTNNILNADAALKAVSAKKFYDNNTFTGTSIVLQANAGLKEHVTPVPALLICINGDATFTYTNEENIQLSPGSYVAIEANRAHKLVASVDSHFVLLR